MSGRTVDDIRRDHADDESCGNRLPTGHTDRAILLAEIDRLRAERDKAREVSIRAGKHLREVESEKVALEAELDDANKWRALEARVEELEEELRRREDRDEDAWSHATARD